MNKDKQNNMRFRDFFYKYLTESAEVVSNIKSRNPKEIWKVAQDMRKHPEDYPDLNLADLIRERYFAQGNRYGF